VEKIKVPGENQSIFSTQTAAMYEKTTNIATLCHVLL
jgi:hypothetical protein